MTTKWLVIGSGSTSRSACTMSLLRRTKGRPAIFTSRTIVFSVTVSPCWFLCALSAAYDRSRRVHRLRDADLNGYALEMPGEEWLRRQRGRGRELLTYATATAAERAAQRRYWFFRLAGLFTPVIASDGDLGRIFVSTRDLTVGMQTFVRGGYDYQSIKEILAVLEHYRPGWDAEGVIVEVGANIGTTTLMLASHAPVVAFEPVPSNVALLRQNLLSTGLQDRVTVRAAAVSEVSGEVTMELAAVNHGDHRVRLSDTPGSYDEQGRGTIRVPGVRLDDELIGQDVSLVWMDAQGHEAQVLAGAPDLLASAPPMVVEYWPYGLRRADGLDRLEQLVAEHFTTVVDTSCQGRARELEAADLPVLRDRYPTDGEHTNLLLLR